MSTIRPISEKQLEANRRNASQSTGPKTEAGKQASRLNAVTHGLLAKTAVITMGDYQEDEQEFAQLLEDLREQFTPVAAIQIKPAMMASPLFWVLLPSLAALLLALYHLLAARLVDTGRRLYLDLLYPYAPLYVHISAAWMRGRYLDERACLVCTLYASPA